MPVAMALLPLGLVLGSTLADSSVSGVSRWTSTPLIFAGSANIAAVQMLSAGATWAELLVVVGLMNARGLIYSASLATAFQRQPKWARWLGAYLLVDPLFALVASRTDDGPRAFRAYYFAAGGVVWLIWQCAVVAGMLAGALVPQALPLGFGSVAVFVALLVPSVAGASGVVAIMAGALGAVVGTAACGPLGLAVVVGAGTLAGQIVGRSDR